MKIVTFTVPCCNCENYLQKCVDSLLKGGEDIEILLVNDGSRDDTLAIAKSYEERFPDIVRVLDKEYGGVGSCVNAALKAARGLYFKPFGSDDWADTHALKTLLGIIRTHLSTRTLPDLYLVNYTFEHVADNSSHPVKFGREFPAGKRTEWKKVKSLRGAATLSAHALVYKTETLKRSALILPEEGDDDLYAYAPLPFAATLFYLDVDLYRRFVGRTNPDADIADLAKNYPAEVESMLRMAERFGSGELKNFPKGLRANLWHALLNRMRKTTLALCTERSRERKTAEKEMWEHLRSKDKKLYKKLRLSKHIFFVKLLPQRLRGLYLSGRYRACCRRLKIG